MKKPGLPPTGFIRGLRRLKTNRTRMSPRRYSPSNPFRAYPWHFPRNRTYKDAVSACLRAGTHRQATNRIDDAATTDTPPHLQALQAERHPRYAAVPTHAISVRSACRQAGRTAPPCPRTPKRPVAPRSVCSRRAVIGILGVEKNEVELPRLDLHEIHGRLDQQGYILGGHDDIHPLRRGTNILLRRVIEAHVVVDGAIRLLVGRKT